jgi:glycosyltransferase involved in cell wall biosynthesis
MNKGRISIHIPSKNRPVELALCIQSLRTQTYQNWDLLILDDGSDGGYENVYYLMYLFNRLKLEGHLVKMLRVQFSLGMSNSRQYLIENDDFENEFVAEIDDDVILEEKYFEKLIEVINKGYDMASGVTPPIMQPELVRKNSFVHPIINRIDLDETGKIINYQDDCGMAYEDSEILPADQFRSCRLWKSEITQKCSYQKNLSPVGFREDAFFCMKAILNGYKIGVHTHAYAYHLMCPSGGCRNINYPLCVQLDHESFEKFIINNFKEKGDFLKEYHERVLREL